MNKRHWTFWLKCALWPVLLFPAVRIAYGLWSDLTHGTLLLTANPVEYMIRQSGYWGLCWLLAGLAIRPIGKMLPKEGLIRTRRLVGLFGFAYIIVHFSLYAWLEQSLMLSEITHDIAQRPFILFGMIGLIILLPLALTSTQWSQKKLGGNRWRTLHKGAYIAPIFGAIHYYFLVKADHHLPILFACVLVGLLSTRLPLLLAFRKKHPQ
ncbi:sulfoxide reductase heme-binding subunit YedZ [Leeia sp. TBRC 13508]|uniref:Protein-methionine-sulfoxide reductase heme-binding subunit MsrQ n=1 Tax=Leeia speluncae TaxID=2884804 RepID=A0ABS8D6J6_9NEIS|nr:protein-methionine-sulfoxide reductase heme-binding subunit MsrQ [Leeia speluncae]MCB6183826.1 sulfoxide reductase heme-binding subunit YedZ [Leeia speluncae]